MNKPAIKNGIKVAASTVTFVFGTVAFMDVCQMLLRRVFRVSLSNPPSHWLQFSNVFILYSRRLSLVLSMATTKIGVDVISRLADHIMSKKQQESLFGENTIFEAKPWHPRHVVSIAAVLLGLPAFFCSAYTFLKIPRILRISAAITEISTLSDSWLTAATLNKMNAFNIITSRPVLHQGNLYCQKILTAQMPPAKKVVSDCYKKSDNH